MADFQFVSYSPTQKTKPKAGSSVVRAHAARHQWRVSQKARDAHKAVRGKRRTPQWQMELKGSDTSEDRSEDELSSSGSTDSTFSLPHIELLVGGTRVDPFQSFPGEWKPYYPNVVDHYLSSIAVDIPELDQTTRGSLRSGFFRLALSEPSTFLSVLLFASCHYSTIGTTLGANELLRLKQDALESINEALRTNQLHVSDALIGTVAKMASFEAMYGEVQTYLAHMSGLKRMIELRGGLDQLGLGGLLRRLILWIDINAGFLLNVPVHFPGEIFAEFQTICDPNPEHFTGNSHWSGSAKSLLQS